MQKENELEVMVPTIPSVLRIAQQRLAERGFVFLFNFRSFFFNIIQCKKGYQIYACTQMNSSGPISERVFSTLLDMKLGTF